MHESWTFTFEDTKGEVLPDFYEKFYDLGFTKIKWLGGNGNMWNLVNTVPLHEGFEILYLDCNPWNRSIFDVYYNMCKKIRRCGYYYVIIPIVCSEYNYLASLDKKYLVEKGIMYKLVTIRKLDSITNSDIKTYEDFCKWSACHSTVKEASVDKDLNRDLLYFNKDTFNDKLSDKWFRYVQQFELFPEISKKVVNHSKAVHVGIEEICKFQNRRVELFNTWADSVETTVTRRLQPIKIEWYS